MAASLLALRRPGAARNAASVGDYAADMTAGRWLLNGMPILISRRGVVLDGVQRLLACEAAGRPFPSFIARDLDDGVLPTIDQHRRRSFASILASRGVPHAHAQVALVARLMRYDSGMGAAATGPAASWGRTARVILANPGLEAAVASSLAMSGSPLPEPVRTAMVYMGGQVDQAAIDRLLAALARPDAFAHGEPGVVLRTDLDRMAEASAGELDRTVLFALAIKALNAQMRGESPRRITWAGPRGPDTPGEAFPRLDGYRGLAEPGVDDAEPAAERIETPNGVTVQFEAIDQALAKRYLAMAVSQRTIIRAHVTAMARDMAAGRWMRNAQPICFSLSGRLINGQHRLMAIVAARAVIDVPVVRGLPEAADATYDLQARRMPEIKGEDGAFGDQALASAMATLLWRQERRSATTGAKAPTASEIAAIHTEYPRLRAQRGVARRMLAFGRASVMGYGAFVMEREDPKQAALFLAALENGADLVDGYAIRPLRDRLRRLRSEQAAQESQLAALLSGWALFKLRPPAPRSGASVPEPASRAGSTGGWRQTTERALDPPIRHVATTRADIAAALHRSDRQHALIVQLGNVALRGGPPQAMMDEAAHAAAEGLEAAFAQVLAHEAQTGLLNLRAGVGWRAGAIGKEPFRPGPSSPAGYAFASVQPVWSNDFGAERRFAIPPLLAEHGVRRVVNAVIGGFSGALGIVEVDDIHAGAFATSDIRFVQAIANVLGLVLARRRTDGSRSEG